MAATASRAVQDESTYVAGWMKACRMRAIMKEVISPLA